MDPNSLASSTTKVARPVRFKPKAPPARKEQKLVVAKIEKVEVDAQTAESQELLRRFEETPFNARPKIERKEGPKVNAFLQTGRSIKKQDPDAPANNGVDKEYKEPWDHYSYYPVTLPLRMLQAGDPELLDELEFGNGSESQKYDEDSINAGEQLGLKDENQEPVLLFLQLPSKLPMPVPKEQPGKDTDVNGTAPNKSSFSRNRNTLTLDDLPKGYMGKLVVYKSGAVKLKLGDNLYDVASGVDSTFAQDMVSINSEDKRCCAVGEPNKRAIITPDLDSMFDNKLDL